MALNFPENKGILEGGVGGAGGAASQGNGASGFFAGPFQRSVAREQQGGGNLRNRFSRIWHGYFEAVHKKFVAFDALTNIATDDMGTAGGAYSQTEMQKQNDLINELKAKVNALQNAAKT